MIRLVRTEHEFLQLEGIWRELRAHSVYQSPFASWEWASLWWKHYHMSVPGRLRPPHLFVLVLTDNVGQTNAIVPFHDALGNPLGFPTPAFLYELRLLGDFGRDGEGTTEEPILLFRCGCQQEAFTEIVDFLEKDRSIGWDFFKLRYNFPVINQAQSPGDYGKSKVTGTLTRFQEGTATEAVTLPDSWETYVKTLSHSMRDNLKYYPRRLWKHGHSYQVMMTRTPQEITHATETLIQLHNHRAQSPRGVPHTSHVPTERQADFLRECLPRLAATGQAFIATLLIQGEPVAAQAFLTNEQEWIVYYSGFLTEWYDYSPLLILQSAVFQEAIAQGVGRLNFLFGDEPWKRRWGAKAFDHFTELCCVRKEPGSLLRFGLRYGEWQTDWLRRSTGKILRKRSGLQPSLPLVPPTANPSFPRYTLDKPR